MRANKAAPTSKMSDNATCEPIKKWPANRALVCVRVTLRIRPAGAVFVALQAGRRLTTTAVKIHKMVVKAMTVPSGVGSSSSGT